MNDNDLLNMKTNFGMGFTIQSILDENSDLLKVNPLLTDSTKQKSEDVWSSLDAQAAFLGPNLWGSSPESDLKLEYVDLEQFLDENDLLGAGSLSPQPPVTPPPADGLMTPLTASPPPPPPPPTQEVAELAAPVSPPSAPRDIPKPAASRRAAQDKPKPARRERSARSPRVPVKFEISPADLALASVPGAEFDPQTHHFSEDDLKPQPMCKKSKKQVVPEESKDQKYWTRRERNNYAAKRSRDARRLKENQIILRANFLEKENSALKETLEQMTRENERLRARVSTCTCRQ